jgi:hypothetical protein
MKSGEKSFFSQAAKGVLMAVPVLFVFLYLLSSADLVFQKYVSDILSVNLESEAIFRVVLVLMVTAIFTGAYSYAFGTREESVVTKEQSKTQRIGRIEGSILLGSVIALFSLFILVQLTYLFGGEGNITAQGFTYADYARRGFFELIAVAIISFLLLLTTEKCSEKKEDNHAIGLKILSTVLVGQVFFIMTSAFTRLLLYEEAYGFTTLRLYSHAFIILLAVIFCLLLYKIYRDSREQTFAFRIFLSIIIFLGVMNVFNPDAFIARQNIERYRATDNIDVYYLGGLSDDAMPELARALGSAPDDVRGQIANELYWRTQKTDDALYASWQSKNISRTRAKNILTSILNELEPYKDFQPQGLE